jgi:valyl-tRNA synthetase
MPFLTEELWQRLPRRPNDKTPSVVLAKYPEYDSALDDVESERAYELILGCSKGIRSLLQENGIKENGKAFVQPFSTEAHSTASAESASIKSLAGKYLTNLTILKPNEAIPAPAIVYPVSSSAAVFVELPSGADTGKEAEKLKPKLQAAAAAVKEQEKLLSTLSDKVGQDVRAMEESRLNDMLSEQKVYEETIQRFEQMKL